MKLTLLTIGSRGDVQPFLALGRALADAGHEPRIATHPHFGPLVRRAELEFAPIAEGAISAGPQSAESERWIRSRSRYLPTWVGYLQDARSVAGERLSDALAACADSDAIIASDLATIVGWQMAEHFDRPLVRVNLNLPAGGRSMRGPIPRAIRGVAWRAARGWLDGVRGKVGLPALPAADPIRALDLDQAPVLRAYSPAVGSVPTGGRDWIHVTGYWFLERRLDPDPSPELSEFIASGPPPVCLDFGSMLDADPSATTWLAVEALQRAGRRGVLIRGRYRASDVQLPTTILGIDAAPHDWLLQRCSAVVHHAGAGTTAAVLAAGAPSVPIPHTAEQRRWARRINALAVATPPIPRRRLSVERLHAAVTEATENPELSTNAALLGATVRAENGVGTALRVIERYLGSAAQPIPTPSRVSAR
jgi:sterol 3beta-glucosyltransferase